MIACSFLPAATQMIYDMGLQHLLYGIVFECPPQALAEKQKIVRCLMERKNYSSAEIDKIFSASKAQGKSLYYVEEELLEQLQPDIIFTQDTCEVCQIDTKCTAAAVAKLTRQPQIIPLTPDNLKDVYQSAITIATAFGHEEAAYRYLAALQKRTAAVLDTLRLHQMPLKRVMLMEWIEPIYNCGHWIPFQIAQAGGIDMLSNPAGDSIVTPWDKIVKYNPEVLVIAPCCFHIDRANEEMHLLTKKSGWDVLEAVKINQVYLADFDLFTQPSASTLVDGIELLAALFHPRLFKLPAILRKNNPVYNPFIKRYCMIIFVTGGARSGKSSHAQQLALSLSDNPVYVATAKIWDNDFEKRVKRHQNERDERWVNYEEQRNVNQLPITNKVCVIDCVTLWLTNFFIDSKNDIDVSLILFKEQIDALHKMPGTFVIISNEIGMGVHSETEIGRKFTDLQGWANQYAANKADKVILMVSGIPVIIKGNNNG